MLCCNDSCELQTPCGHSFCLKCFEKWIRQGKRTCAKCRQNIPASMASQPRINSALVFAIRMARASKANGGAVAGPSGVRHFLHNQDRPDQAYTTDRAQRSGRANACSGKIFVTVPTDHFGPILPQNDPLRNQGLLVGESWLDRLECRQWGAHFVHVGGIAGQSDRGAQSVVLSGGYVDDQDHGEWFLYTGRLVSAVYFPLFLFSFLNSFISSCAAVVKILLGISAQIRTIPLIKNLRSTTGHFS